MSHPLNHTWSALCVCSASLFRMLFLWPGVVLAMFGLLFLLATFADGGGQRAADMAVTASAGSALFAFGVIVQLSSVLIRRCQRHHGGCHE
ncbi:hypothetical protein [Serratia ureilytica]|uniref:hypothetical protein n=1 Tax=Serratia ureilytica TaxID=300181 RepID=UPI0019D0AAE5|nr:hypothetical protein [Serratia ureilytica]MBN5215736.1 hypothetical protein [Serratia ureilytica]